MLVSTAKNEFKNKITKCANVADEKKKKFGLGTKKEGKDISVLLQPESQLCVFIWKNILWVH